MPTTIPNDGSTTRDYCMLERNFLAHIKLALLLSLVSSSILLHAKLVLVMGSSSTSPTREVSHAGVPMATSETVVALFTIGAGCWEYFCGIRDLRDKKAFFIAQNKPYLGIMAAISVVVLATCVILLASQSQL